ncbi:MAG: 30S ribosomal protein S14 [Legionellales bacterium]|nr:30S ribosomal protein S14 [Legionellales bacterium]
MAKTSVREREQQKVDLVRKYAKKTADIKSKIREAILADLNSQNQNESRVFENYLKLNKLPRNASRTRVTRRCNICSRGRSVYRAYGLCRICLRQAAMRGDIPGLVKSSW